MSRASGRRTGQPDRTSNLNTSTEPDSPQGRDIGMSKRAQGVPSPIPGGREHIVNHPSVRTEPARPAPRGEYRGTMAHGVPPGSATTGERADMMRGPADLKSPAPRFTPVKDPVPPVPVYIVETGSGPRPLRTAIMRHLIVPGLNGDPVLLCGRDVNRAKVRLMNADATNNIRIASDLVSLAKDQGTTNKTIGGVVLIKGMTGYQDIETQDEIWAITQDATATCEVEIIMETYVPGGAGR